MGSFLDLMEIDVSEVWAVVQELGRHELATAGIVVDLTWRSRDPS